MWSGVAGEPGRVAQHRRPQGRPVDAARRVEHAGEFPADGLGRRATGPVQGMHRRIGIVNRDTLVHEHLARGRLSHADGAGQAENNGHDVSPPASTCDRSASVTLGRTPNQRSNPGTA